MSTNAITIRTSLDSSLDSFLGGVGELILFEAQHLARYGPTEEPNRRRPHGKDGNGPDVSSPSRSPVRRHALQSPPAYIASRSDKTGKPTAAVARSGVCTRRGAGGGIGAPDEKTVNLGLKFCEEAILRFPPGIEYDGPLGTQ